MDENRFFKWIWRLNGLIILIILLFAAFSLFPELLRSINWGNGEEEIITSVAEDPEGKEKWALGYPTQIKGSDYILLPLVSENREVEMRGGISLKSAYRGINNDPAKNILFINTTLNEPHWLLKGTDQLILNTEEFPYSYRLENNDAETKVIFYELIESDSNRDGVLNYKDKRSLALSSPEGNNYQIVLDEFDRIVAKSMVDGDKVLIVFQTSSVGYSMLIRLEPFEVLTKKEIPKIGDS